VHLISIHGQDAILRLIEAAGLLPRPVIAPSGVSLAN
jgi:hypothetical protein